MATGVLFANMMSMPVDSMWHKTAVDGAVDFAMPAVEANSVLSVCLQLVQWRSQGGGRGAMAPPKLLVNVFFLQ